MCIMAGAEGGGGSYMPPLGGRRGHVPRNAAATAAYNCTPKCVDTVNRHQHHQTFHSFSDAGAIITRYRTTEKTRNQQKTQKNTHPAPSLLSSRHLSQCSSISYSPPAITPSPPPSSSFYTEIQAQRQATLLSATNSIYTGCTLQSSIHVRMFTTHLTRSLYENKISAKTTQPPILYHVHSYDTGRQ